MAFTARGSLRCGLVFLMVRTSAVLAVSDDAILASTKYPQRGRYDSLSELSSMGKAMKASGIMRTSEEMTCIEGVAEVLGKLAELVRRLDNFFSFGTQKTLQEDIAATQNGLVVPEEVQNADWFKQLDEAFTERYPLLDTNVKGECPFDNMKPMQLLEDMDAWNHSVGFRPLGVDIKRIAKETRDLLFPTGSAIPVFSAITHLGPKLQRRLGALECLRAPLKKKYSEQWYDPALGGENNTERYLAWGETL